MLSYTLVQDVPQESLGKLGCILSPMLQMQLMFHMAFVQMSFQQKISFSNISNNVFPGLSVSLIMIIATGMVVFWLLLILYLWPLIIEVDPEKNLRWFYPLTASYWSGSSKDEGEKSTRSIAYRDGDEEDKPAAVPLIGTDSRESLTRADLQESEKQLVMEGKLELPPLSA